MILIQIEVNGMLMKYIHKEETGLTGAAAVCTYSLILFTCYFISSRHDLCKHAKLS